MECGQVGFRHFAGASFGIFSPMAPSQQQHAVIRYDHLDRYSIVASSFNSSSFVDAFGVGVSVRYASTTVKGRAGAKLRTRKETTTGAVGKRQRVQKAKAAATAEEREDNSTTTTSTTTTASAGHAAGTRKVRKSKAKTQPQEDAKQEYDKAELGEEPSTPPLVVYPQTLVPSSVLDMISTPQQGKASNGVRALTLDDGYLEREHSHKRVWLRRVQRFSNSTPSSSGPNLSGRCSWTRRGETPAPLTQ